MCLQARRVEQRGRKVSRLASSETRWRQRSGIQCSVRRPGVQAQRVAETNAGGKCLTGVFGNLVDKDNATCDCTVSRWLSFILSIQCVKRPNYITFRPS